MFTNDDAGKAAEANAIADLVRALIDTQMILVDPAKREKHDFMKDDLSLGYIFGFTDGVLQSRDINETDVRSMVTPSRTFQRLFGREHGPVLLGYALKNLQSATIEKGRGFGGEDYFDWLESQGKKLPLKLANAHLRETGSEATT